MQSTGSPSVGGQNTLKKRVKKTLNRKMETFWEHSDERDIVATSVMNDHPVIFFFHSVT